MVLIIVIKNQTTKHIHVDSDHPLSITKQIQEFIKKRLSTLSSSKYIFHKAVSCYEQGLTKWGCNKKLIYQQRGRNGENKVKIKKTYNMV